MRERKAFIISRWLTLVLLVLPHIPHVLPDFLDMFLEPFLVYLISAHSVEELFGDVPLCNIDHFYGRESNDISQLFAPTLFIHQWCIVTFRLTSVDMNPSLVLINPDLCPYVISPIKYLSRFITKCYTDRRKAVCPLSASSSSCFNKLHRVTVRK